MRRSLATMTLLASTLLSCSVLPLRTPAPASEPSESRVQAMAAFLAERATGIAPEQLEQVSRTVIAESDRTGFTPGLIAALIHVESSGRNFAVSRAGALGLMQLLPHTAREVAERRGMGWDGPEMLFDPVVNVRLGVDYLAYLYRRFGSVEVALAAYNWGPTYIAELQQGGSGIPLEYTQRVLHFYHRSSREIGLG